MLRDNRLKIFVPSVVVFFALGYYVFSGEKGKEDDEADATDAASNSTSMDSEPVVQLPNPKIEDPETSPAGEPINEGVGFVFENPEVIVTAQELSEQEQLTDFKMMNPGILDADANDGMNQYEVVTNPIDWVAANQHEKLPDGLLSEEQFEAASQSVVPVLLPPRLSLLESGFVSVGDTWYAVSMDDDQINVFIEGSSSAVVVPNTEQREGGSLDSFEISRSLGMAEVYVNAFGVGYTITVECFDHQSDPACVDDGYLTDLVASLLLVDGENNEDGA